MIIHDRSFPHPVLTPLRDDVLPNTFGLKLQVSSDADAFYIDVNFDYSNPTLVALVEQGHALHSLHLECRRNFYRQMHSFKERTQRITIKASELVGRVEVCGFICASSPIAAYKIDGAHLDYGDANFNVRPGDILAVAPTQVFDAYVDYDPLELISSILTIRRSESVDEGAMTLDMNEDRIVATLSKRDYDRYTDLKPDPSLGPLLANQVVVPALLEAVHEIRATDEDNLEVEMAKRWFRSIYKKLSDMGLDVRSSHTSILEAVQALLKLPLRRSLEGLMQLNPLEDSA